MSGAPVEEFLRAVKSSALRAGEQLSNWAQALVRPWEGHGDGAQPSIKPRQKEGQRKGEPVRGFLRGFGGPLTGILPPRPGPKPKLREARVADRPLVVQDVQDAREARILDAEAKGAEMSPQLAVSAPSYGVGGGLALDLREAEPEVNSGNAVSKEELGRSTWTFLHTLAAQFPEKPTRQQQRDVKELMQILSRLYPCKVCADHFKEVLRTYPVQTGSGFELAQWLCRVHNVVNRSLGKAPFSCKRVDARWGSLACDEGACDLEGRIYRK